jgi:hypothetical protein
MQEFAEAFNDAAFESLGYNGAIGQQQCLEKIYMQVNPYNVGL